MPRGRPLRELTLTAAEQAALIMCQLSWHGWVDSCEGIRLQAVSQQRFGVGPPASLRERTDTENSGSRRLDAKWYD